MDIHKPKPWHGVREFLKEYGIIVLGVLTALAFEQTVEWLHTQHDIHQTREALLEEVGANAATAVLSAEQGKCLITWAERSVAWAHGGARPKAAIPAGLDLSSIVWESSRSGAVVRMPLQERLKFAGYYGGVEEMKLLDRQVREALIRTYRYSRLEHLDARQAQSLEEEMNTVIPLLVGLVSVDRLIVHRSRPFDAPDRHYDAREARRLIEQLCGNVGAPRPAFSADGDERSDWEWYARMAGDRPAVEPKR
jgi:hypothetical protein